jgi:hypothetical protein
MHTCTIMAQLRLCSFGNIILLLERASLLIFINCVIFFYMNLEAQLQNPNTHTSVFIVRRLGDQIGRRQWAIVYFG